MKYSIYCCFALIEPYQRPHHPPIFNILSLFLILFFLINFPTYCYNFSNFSPLFYIFISLPLFTLILIFFYPFIFLYFLLFLFLSSYYKFIIFFSIELIVFSHTKCYFSPSLSLSLSLTHTHTFSTHTNLFLSHFYFPVLVDFFSYISTLGWWIFVLFWTLLCVFKLLFFFILFDFTNVIILQY